MTSRSRISDAVSPSRRLTRGPMAAWRHLPRAVVLSVTMVVVGAAVFISSALLTPRSTPIVYSVEDVATGLRRQPTHWAGRTILIRSSIAAWGATLCPTSGGGTVAPICRQQTRWVYLGPTSINAGFAIPNLSPAPSSAAGWAGGSNLPVTFSPPQSSIVAAPTSPILLVLLRPGRLSPVPQARRGLPPALLALPLIGQAISHLFPTDNRVTVRIRLNQIAAQTCAVTVNTPCSDGLLLSP